jgi:flagellar M-ring protein FliF
MLAAVIGTGNAVVRVSAEIDTEAVTQSAEKYDPESQVVRQQTQTDDTTNSQESRAAGGATGVSANVPEKTQGVAAEARPVNVSEQNRKNKSTTYEINKVVTNTTRSPGTLKNVTAAVFVAPRMVTPAPGADGKVGEPQAQKRTQQELDALRQVVINALGLRAAPGQALDTLVSLQEMPFQNAERLPAALVAATAGETKLQGWFELASRWVAVAGAAIVLLVFLRMLSSQKPEPVPVEVFSLPPDAQQRALNSPNSITPELLNELIRQKPANVGVALRDWVAAGSTATASKN